MHQHFTPLRTRVPEISSDFALLCACAHSDATFYEANSSRTAARSVNGRRQSPAAIAIDHRPSQTSSSIRLRPQLPPRALFRGVPSPTHLTRKPTHSLCVPIARARQGGCTQARRRRAEVERPRSSRATGGARAWSPAGLSRPSQVCSRGCRPGAGRIYRQTAGR